MRSTPAILAALVTLVALTGCQPDATPIIPDPAPSSDLLFESEDEALAAAEEAYGAYLAALDRIFADGGANPERLRDVATEDVYLEQLSGFQRYVDEGKRGTGETLFDSMVLQSADLTGGLAEDTVVVYVCEDFSQTDVLGADGKSVVAEERKTRWPLTVSFDVRDDGVSTLVVASSEDWTGADFCADSEQ